MKILLKEAELPLFHITQLFSWLLKHLDLTKPTDKKFHFLIYKEKLNIHERYSIDEDHLISFQTFFVWALLLIVHT